jgi:chromosome segregation ATPase
MIRFLLIFALMFSTLVTRRLPAAEAGEGNEAKLREVLRATTLQLRSAENERATLQSAQAALAEDKKTLEAKFETLRKQTITERAANDKLLAALKTEAAAKAAEIAKLKEAMEKSTAAGQQAVALAAAKESERAQLAAQLILGQRKLEDRETKNLALFSLGLEILKRYEKFSLGEALAAREPFVGSTRAKLETLVQGYNDKLLDQRVKP